MKKIIPDVLCVTVNTEKYLILRLLLCSILFFSSDSLKADDLNFFRQAKKFYDSGEYKKAQTALNAVRDDYVAADFVHFLKIRCAAKIDQKLYKKLISGADTYFSREFPYRKQLIKEKVDLLIEEGRFSDALSLVKDEMSDRDWLFYCLSVELKDGRAESGHYLKLIAETADRELILRSIAACGRKLAVVMKDLPPDLKNRIIVHYAEINQSFSEKDFTGISSDQWPLIKGIQAWKKKDRDDLWKQAVFALNSKKSSRAADFLKKLVEISSKKEYFSLLSDRISTSLKHDSLSVSDKASLTFEMGKFCFSNDMEKPGYEWLKKALGFSEKVKDSEMEKKCLIMLAKLCYRFKNYSGSGYFSHQFAQKFQNSIESEEMTFLRYRTAACLGNKEEADQLETLVIAKYPDSPFTLYLNKTVVSGYKPCPADTHEKLSLPAEMEKTRFYHLFHAGFTADALRLINEYRTRDKILLGLCWYKSFVPQGIYPVFYSEEIDRAAKKYELDSSLILAVIREESRFDMNAVSRVSAGGLMQIMPATYKWLAGIRKEDYEGIQALFRPQLNIDYGSYYLRYLLDMFKDTGSALIFSIAAYNGGPGNVRRWIERYGEEDTLLFIPYEETRNYLKKVTLSFRQYRKIS